MCALTFTVRSRAGTRALTVLPRAAIIAGWTGRDRAALEQHIEELAALGVPRPARVPVFYRVAPALLSTAPVIDVLGTGSTGEAECVLIAGPDGLYIGAGSDHTDRDVERHSIALSKQVCAKPLAPEVWPLAEVEPHWDALVLRSHAWIDGERVLYQEGGVAALRSPMDLARACTGGAGFAQQAVMYCGTLPAHAAVQFATRFELELEDPVLGRSLRHAYGITPLPAAEWIFDGKSGSEPRL
jgi:hypothetical protein